MLCDRGHEGSGAGKLGGYIHIFRTIALPQTHRPITYVCPKRWWLCWRRRQGITPKRRYLSPKRHGVTSWKTRAFFSAVLFWMQHGARCAERCVVPRGQAQPKWECICNCMGYVSLFYILLFMYNFVNIRTLTKLRPLRYRLIQEILFVSLIRLNYYI